MGFLDPTTDFRYILPTETDANSALSEELMSQIRENIESNIMDTKYYGSRFEVVSVDSDTEMTITKVDAGDPDWSEDEFTLLLATMRTGFAIGNNYQILSNDPLTTGNATITFTGTTLTADGIVAGDIGLIMYTMTGQAHTHDGLDSPAIGSNDIWHRDDGAVLWVDNSVTFNSDIITERFYVTSTANRIFAKFRCYNFASFFFSDELNDWTFRMVAKAGTYNYVDDQGDYKTYTLASDVYGPSLVIGTGDPVPSGLSEVDISIGRDLYALNLLEAGVPIGAPVMVGVHGIGHEVSGASQVSSRCDTYFTLFSAP